MKVNPTSSGAAADEKSLLNPNKPDSSTISRNGPSFQKSSALN